MNFLYTRILQQPDKRQLRQNARNHRTNKTTGKRDKNTDKNGVLTRNNVWQLDLSTETVRAKGTKIATKRSLKREHKIKNHVLGHEHKTLPVCWGVRVLGSRKHF
ncbi:hypothetical protein JTE90_001826 [Oedothorax gibbosus]|uniref:Uncharacterized protein n=1 Tax=Oedothorax gibbosus TaxID=931172 RepID=A0AAV6U368_9ARAC|nr:hypothetical protein JTE90_001826 [Oedothorax gibbosus]